MVVNIEKAGKMVGERAAVQGAPNLQGNQENRNNLLRTLRDKLVRSKTARRVVAGTALLAGAGLSAVGAKFVLGEDESAGTPSVSEANTKIEASSKIDVVEQPIAKLSIFGQVSEKVNSSPSANKEQLITFVNNLEKSESVLGSFMTLYESQKEADGTPTLLKMEMQKVDKVDLSQSYPKLSREEALKRYAEDRIFFLRDWRNLTGMKSLLQADMARNDTTSLAKHLEGWMSSPGYFTVDYLALNSLPHKKGLLSIDIDQSSLTKGAEKAAALKAFADIFFNRAPKIGDRLVVIKAGYSGEYVADGNKMEVGVEGGHELLAHEYGHFLDTENNLMNMISYFSTQEIYSMILQKDGLLETYWNLPSVDRVFRAEKLPAYNKVKSGQRLTEEEFETYASIDIDKRWIDGIDFFDKQIGVDEIQSNSYGAGRSITHDNVQAFLNAQSKEINTLVEKYPVLKDFINDVRSRPKVYDNWWISVSPAVDGSYEKNEKNWWSGLGDMARVWYLEQVLTGKVKVNQEDLSKVLNFKSHISNEFVANSLGLGLLYEDRIEGFGKTMVGSYISNFR